MSDALPVEIRPGSGAMFDRIARRYDLVNRVVSFGIDRGWRKQAARAVGAASRVLDLATGTADLAIAIARQLPTASVVGTDPSDAMRRVGADKIAAAGLSARVELTGGEAETIAQDDRSFDAVTIAFGIRNVPDRQKALAEMSRVCRDGGRVVVLELTEPRAGFLAPFARLHVHVLVPWLGALFSGAPEYRYLERSIAKFPSAQEFASMMEGAGMTMIETRPLAFGAAHLFIAEPRRATA